MIGSAIHGLLDRCESPIERKFAEAFLEDPRVLVAVEGVSPEEWIITDRQDGLTLVLMSQWRVRDGGAVLARADFAFRVYERGWRPALIVELDGHEWHEKTKEQAAHDKRRDRILLSMGLRVAHFTGSEVHADPVGCAWRAFCLAIACVCYGNNPATLESLQRGNYEADVEAIAELEADG